MQDEQVGQQPPASDQLEERRKTFARRALLQAGWAIPVVTAFAIPNAAFAGSAHNDSVHNDGQQPHGDEAHVDANPHSDLHFDEATNPHGDLIPHGDEVTPHNDTPHNDTPPHVDLPHTDAPGAP